MSDQISMFRAAYQQGFKDGFRAAQEIVPTDAPKPDAETELPDLGEGMPSDADMLLYATPFFETDTEKKEAAAKDDADEDLK